MDGVTIKPDGKGHLLVTLPYSKARVEQIKQVPGHAWNPDSKLWSVPDTPEAHQALTEMFTMPPEPTVEHIPVAPPKPGQRPATKRRSPFIPGKPLTTNPLHPLIKAVDDELVLRGMAYPQAFGSGTRKNYGQPTECYTHVSQKAMGQIRSPLDRLDLSGAGRASKKGGAP